MNLHNESTPTDLYLVRIWRSRQGSSIAVVRGKLQHVVSGASCYFDNLADLPEALREMLEEQGPSSGPDSHDSSPL